MVLLDAAPMEADAFVVLGCWGFFFSPFFIYIHIILDYFYKWTLNYTHDFKFASKKFHAVTLNKYL